MGRNLDITRYASCHHKRQAARCCMSSLKRETSLSVSELHSISDSVKRISLRSGSESEPNSIENSPVSVNKVKGKSGGRSAGNSPTYIGGSKSPALFPDSASRTDLFSALTGEGRKNSSGSTGSNNSGRTTPVLGKMDSIFDSMQTEFKSSERTSSIGSDTTPGTVLDKLSHKDVFLKKYEFLREIGRGGFSHVYQCQDYSTRTNYACKVIDLRPLRLREGFDPIRLRREVDIMRRLRHPNIVEFIEGFETEDQVLMVLEYCPGKELFNVILERKSFSEADAKPVFAQISRALFYLHSLNIIHRDVKPENILVLDTPGPRGELQVKLLDFGLSKNAGAGSEAKTFVGTPCYLSPEVEHTSKGVGGTYGLPADCWSLGAVLYVMLVARFPEFEHDPVGKVVLRLPEALWGGVSAQGKHMVRNLMNTDQHQRMTTGDALLHPWLEQWRSSDEELTRTKSNNLELGQLLQRNVFQGQANQVNTMTPGGVAVAPTEMVLRARGLAGGKEENGGGMNVGGMISPLYDLQKSVAICFNDAHLAYQDIPEVATQVRQGAVLCRRQFSESTKMLYKIEQTATAVLNMFPDLELAVEEGEPELAAEFFDVVKGWVVELRNLVATTQQANHASMEKIQTIVENSTIGLQNRAMSRQQNGGRVPNMPASVNIPRRVLNMVQNRVGRITNGTDEGGDRQQRDTETESDNVQLSSEDLLELFSRLFGSNTNTNTSTSSSSSSPREPRDRERSAGPTGGLRARSGTGSTVSGSDGAASDMGLSEVDESFVEDIDSRDYYSGANDRSALNISKGGLNMTNNSAFMTEDSVLGSGLGDVDMTVIDSSVSSSASNCSRGSASGDEFKASSLDDEIMGGNSDSNSWGGRRSRSGSGLGVPTNSQFAQVLGDIAPLVIPGQEGGQDTRTRDRSNSNEQRVTPTYGGTGMGSPRASNRLTEALHKLRQVDVILEQLSAFWANTELVLDVLTKKGQHVEKLISFAKKPKLLARFQERIGEYKTFWENIQSLCNTYIATAQGDMSGTGGGEGSGSENSMGSDRNSMPNMNANMGGTYDRDNNKGKDSKKEGRSGSTGSDPGASYQYMEQEDNVFRDFISRNSSNSLGEVPPGMNTSGSSASGASRRMSGGSGSVNSRTQEGQRVDKIDSM